MSNKVAIIAATPDRGFGQPQPQRKAPAASAAKAPAPSQNSADLRLVIEEDPSGAYVYKTIDRRTGEVIQQLPRAELLSMREAGSYIAGGVIRTRA